MLISLVDQLAAAYEHDEQRRKLFTKGRDIIMKEKDCSRASKSNFLYEYM